MRKKKEIKAQIKKTIGERKTLPEYSMFGDANWEMLDAELEILNKALIGEIDDYDCQEFVEDNLDNPKEDQILCAQCDTYDWLCERIDEL